MCAGNEYQLHDGAHRRLDSNEDVNEIGDKIYGITTPLGEFWTHDPQILVKFFDEALSLAISMQNVRVLDI